MRMSHDINTSSRSDIVAVLHLDVCHLSKTRLFLAPHRARAIGCGMCMFLADASRVRVYSIKLESRTRAGVAHRACDIRQYLSSLYRHYLRKRTGGEGLVTPLGMGIVLPNGAGDVCHRPAEIQEYVMGG